MANQDKKLSAEEKHDLVFDAIRTLNLNEYKSFNELEAALCTRIRTLQSLTNENSVAMRMLDGIPIYAEVVSCEKEENTTRYLLTFRATNGDEDEHIRSDRTDGRNGKAVDEMWSKIQPGYRVCLYKTQEATKNPNKPTVRVCPYITVLSRPRN